MAEDPTVLSAMDAARVLAPLLVTPDDYLDQYRREVLGEDAHVPIDRLLAARELTFEVARLLKSKDPADWKRLDAGVRAVKESDTTMSEVPDTRVDAPVSIPARPAPSPIAPPAAVHEPKAPPPLSAPTRVSAQPSPWAHATTPPLPAAATSRAAAAPETTPSGPPSSLSKPVDTASLGEESPLAGTELPFIAAAENTAPPPVAAEVADESMVGETMGIGQMSPLAALASMASTVASNGTPPKGAVSVELTLEQYASLSATLEVYPDRRASTLETYGIMADAALVALERSWAAKIALDITLEKRFNDLVAHYREWIRSNG